MKTSLSQLTKTGDWTSDRKKKKHLLLKGIHTILNSVFIEQRQHNAYRRESKRIFKTRAVMVLRIKQHQIYPRCVRFYEF
jgi:hypothetical protein